MKKAIVSALMGLFFGAALVACGGAQAATYSHTFKDDTGNVFSLQGAYQIDRTAGSVKVVASNGTQYTYSDSTGALATKIVAYMGVGGSGYGNWYTLPGTTTSMNVADVLNIGCYGSGGTQTYFSYYGGSYSKFVADGCAARAAIAAGAN